MFSDISDDKSSFSFLPCWLNKDEGNATKVHAEGNTKKGHKIIKGEEKEEKGRRVPFFVCFLLSAVRLNMI